MQHRTKFKPFHPTSQIPHTHTYTHTRTHARTHTHPRARTHAHTHARKKSETKDKDNCLRCYEEMKTHEMLKGIVTNKQTNKQTTTTTTTNNNNKPTCYVWYKSVLFNVLSFGRYH